MILYFRGFTVLLVDKASLNKYEFSSNMGWIIVTHLSERGFSGSNC